jgi:transcriptional/translational regulatory protein YebC/TACO1
MFTKKGYIVVEKSKADERKLMSAVLEAGRGRSSGRWGQLGSAERAGCVQGVRDAVKQLGIEPASAEVSMIPQNYVKLEGKTAQQMVRLMDAPR